MRTDSFERGGQPRSVPDLDREGYERMVRQHRAHMATRHPQVATHPQAPPRGPTQHGPVDAIAATIAHVLNEPRAARREVERGHIVKGAVDAAVAAGDLAWGRAAATGLARGSFKLTGSHTWGATRKWLGKTARAIKHQPVHHALIPNGGWGKFVPEAIKNQPWNLKALESSLEHIRIHGRSRKFDLPQFNAIERYWRGTPGWWKAANASVVGHVGPPIVHAADEAMHFVDEHLPWRHAPQPRKQPTRSATVHGR